MLFDGCLFESMFGWMCGDCGGSECICEGEMSEDVQSRAETSSGDTALFAELNSIRDRLSVLAGGSWESQREVRSHFDEIVKHIFAGRFRKFWIDRTKEEQREPRLAHIPGFDNHITLTGEEANLSKILPDVPVSSREELDLQIKNGFRPQLTEDINADA